MGEMEMGGKWFGRLCLSLQVECESEVYAEEVEAEVGTCGSALSGLYAVGVLILPLVLESHDANAGLGSEEVGDESRHARAEAELQGMSLAVAAVVVGSGAGAVLAHGV